MSDRGDGDGARGGASARAGWIGLAAGAAILAWIAINFVSTAGPGSRGPRADRPLPPFAAPLVASTLVGDANVATRAGEGAAGAVPACDVRDPRALNVCAVARRSPLVLAFFEDRDADCVRQLDSIAAVAPRAGRVRFAAVAIRGDRAQLRALVARHGWRFPVAWDRDGAVANAYAVAVCPTVVYVRRGGTVAGTSLGDATLDPARLRAEVRRRLGGGS